MLRRNVIIIFSFVLSSLLITPDIAAYRAYLPSDVGVTSGQPNVDYIQNTNIKVSDLSNIKNNLSSIAPSWDAVEFVNPCARGIAGSCTKKVTTTLPGLELMAKKKEGRWKVSVDRNRENATEEVLFDKTPPVCAPNPSIEEYDNKQDYYTINGLKNPWPIGLNGQWAKDGEVVAFSKNDPILCRDQITLNNIKKVERKYSVGKCDDVYYTEDKNDCLSHTPTETETLYYMSGCRGASESITVDTFRTPTNYTMFDKAGNKVDCKSPEPKIDRLPVEFQEFKVQHEGLELPLEKLSSNKNSPNKFRADDGPLLLNIGLNDPTADETSGTSGINWEPITTNSDITALEAKIHSKEEALKKTSLEAKMLEMERIVLNSDIALSLASLIKAEASQNLIHQISIVLEDNESELNKALSILSNNNQIINSTDINENGLQQIIAQLSRTNTNKFNQVPEEIKANVQAIIVYIINERKKLYTTELPPLINQANFSEAGTRKNFSNELNKFKSYYEQWAIDKRKNYAEIDRNWVSNLSEIDNDLENRKNEFQAIITESSKTDFNEIAESIEIIYPASPLKNALLESLSTVADHVQKQEATISSIKKANNQINNTVKYLVEFNQNTDVFDITYLTNLLNSLDETNDLVLTLRGEIRDFDTSGTLGQIISTIYASENSNKFSQLINLENQNIRDLQALLVSKQNELSTLEASLQTENDSITTLESLLLTMRSDLSALVLAHTNKMKGTKTETSTVITTTTQTVNQQIEESCTAGGGTVVKDGSTSFCRFDASSCSGSWSQYQNWSTTENVTAADGNYAHVLIPDNCTMTSYGNITNGVCGRFGNPDTGSHNWANRLRETTIYTLHGEGGGTASSCGDRVLTQECTAIITQIGCTISGLTPITTTSTETVTTEVEPDTFDQQNITHIKIERSNSISDKSQEFFPPSTEPDNGNNFIWDINSYRFSGESAPIFTVAGDYKISVKAFDKAKNKSVKQGYIKIYPAKLEVDVNSNCNNASNIRYADNTETCSLTMPLLDRFGNKVQANKKIQLMARDQDINGSYNLVQSLGASFVNGLRFVGGSNAGKQNILAWEPNDQASKTIQLKSLLPTLDVTEYGADPDYAIGYDVTNGVDVTFLLKHPNIGPRGSSLSSPNIDTLNIPVRFKPWINLTAKGSQGSFTNRGWTPPIAKPFDVYVDADTRSSKKLPTDFVVNVTGFIGSSYEFNNLDLAKPGQSISFNSINASYTESTGNGGTPGPFTTTINSVSALSSQQSSRALFIPQVIYQAGGQNIVLPGLPAGTCPDNDPAKCFVINPPTEVVDINISNASTNEPGNLNFTINLSNSLQQDLTVYLEAEHITTQNGDFVMPTQNFVTIPAGSLSASFSVAVPKYQAGEVEADETMRLSVQNVDKPELVNQTTPGIGTIYDQDNALSISDIGAIEGARCLFSFELDRPTTDDVVITTRYGAPSDTAQGGTGKDYDNQNGSFTIPAGQTKVMAPVQTYEDDIAEGTENFTLIVENVQGGDLSALTGETTCQIEDNDIEPNIYLSNETVDEGQNVAITVTLGEGSPSGRPDNEDVVVRLRTYEINSSTLNKATKDIDYVHKTFDVTIPANQKSVTVAPANGIITKADDLIEGDEYFGVKIIGIANGAKVGAKNAKALITIQDKSELPEKPSIASITGETGYETTPTDTVKFTVTLDTPNDTGSPINLTLNLEDDTATGGAGQDYDNSPVTVTILNGEKFGVSAPIEIYNDDIVEETEFFKAVVASSSVSPAGSLIGTFPSGTADIEDGDVPPIDITIEDSLACESVGCANAENNVMNFKVKLSRKHLEKNNPLVVSFEPSKVTPTANDYFKTGTYTATFNYLDQEAQLEPVPLINNLDIDGDKEFKMRFKAVESRHEDIPETIIGDTSDTAKGTIQDDDSAAKPEIIITEGSEIEGNSAVIKVGLTTPAIDETTITLTTRNISTENADYSCLPEELTVIFGVGEMEAQNVQCDLIPDGINEPDEQFEIEVGSVTGTIKPGGDNDKGIITIINYQTLDLVMEEPPVFMENLDGGKAEFVIKLKDNGQPLAADQVLERPISFTITPFDLGTGYGFAEGGSNFAIEGTDYRNAIQTVNLEPGKGLGKTAYTVAVDINNDSEIEINPDVHSYPGNRYESFGMPIDTTSNNVEVITTHDAIIEDEDASSCTDKPKVKVIDDSRVEGEDLQFYVALDRSLCSGEELTLDFETADRSAKAGSDYTAKTISLTFKNSRSGRPASQTIAVSTIDDAEDENGESMYLKYVGATPSNRVDKVERFSVRPSDASHRNRGTVVAGGIAAIGTITDNDITQDAPPTVTISDALTNEGEDLLYEIKLSEPNKGETIEAEFEATPGDANTTTADFNSDQIEGGKILATMVIQQGEQIGTLKTSTNKHAVIHTTENSVTDEPDKKVYLDFLQRIYGRLETTGITAGLGTIKDDDIAISKPSVTISDGAANEGDDITFTIRLENTGSGTNVAPRGGINFTIVTSTNTGPDAAQANEFGSGKIVSLPEGDSSVGFKIETYTDDIEENAEHFNVQIQASDAGTFLGNAADITSGNVNGTGTINDVTPPDECVAFGINCPEEEIILPGAAIEGQIIADKIVCVDEEGHEKDNCDVTNDDSVVLGTSTVATDVREEITRNTYELIRGRTAANIGDIPRNTNDEPIIKRNDFTTEGKLYPRWDIYVDDLPDGGVTYLDGDLDGDGRITGDETRVYFRIGLHRNGSKGTLTNPARVKGKHTFIVENASLNIIGDMVYDTPESSLGIIVINQSIDDLDNLNRRGQLTVYKDVKHIVGALFTDGSFVSNIWTQAGAGYGRVSDAKNGKPNDDWDIVNNDSRLGRQLILTGNILSKNTIGKSDKAIPEGPWGDLNSFPVNERQARAQMYDFNYIRRYVPVYESPGVLDTASRNRCSKVPGQSECYSNTKSFIIRVDPRLKENPPPGFKVDSIQSLR